jgi:hypothetical protein
VELRQTLEILSVTLHPRLHRSLPLHALGIRNETGFLTREHNWADNYTFVAARIHRPASVTEVRKIVAGASRIRAVGARHSFNGIADSPGELIDLGGIDQAGGLHQCQSEVVLGGPDA